MKIGIFGGTFDPVHNGHIESAKYLKQNFKLDKIVFLPLGDAPHKKNVTDGEIRFEMLTGATKEIPYLEVSRTELDRKGKTYTFDTVNSLPKGNEYFYIIGADTLEVLHTWYRAKDVFKMTKFIVLGRSGYSKEKTEAEKMGAKLIFADYTGLDVSSTEIRKCVGSGKSIKDKVPTKVAEVIEKYGLYRD